MESFTMKKRLIHYLAPAALLVLMQGPVFSETASYTIDFVADEGFVEGGRLWDYDDLINSQDFWYADDVNGQGWATHAKSSSYRRCTTEGISLDVGDTVVMVSDIRTQGAYAQSGPANNQFYAFGLDDDSFIGTAQVRLGAVLRFSGTEDLVLSTLAPQATGEPASATAPLADYGFDRSVSDTVRMTMTLTKTPTPNQFYVGLSLQDLTGSGETLTTDTAILEDAGMYAADTLYGIFRTAGISSSTGWTATQVDHFSVDVAPSSTRGTIIFLGTFGGWGMLLCCLFYRWLPCCFTSKSH